MMIPNGSSSYCLPFTSILSWHLHLSHHHSDTWEAFQPYPPLESERMPVSILCIIPSLLTHELRKFGSRSFIHLWTQRNPPSFISFYISVYTSGSFWFLICFLLVWKFHLKSCCMEKVGGWTDFSQHYLGCDMIVTTHICCCLENFQAFVRAHANGWAPTDLC